MVLTLRGSGRWPKVLATVVGPPGGRSELSEVVLVNLLMSEEEEKAHELLGYERNRKQVLTRRVLMQKDLLTQRANTRFKR